MALNKAQLMEVPGGPGVTGAVKPGAGISISSDGTISINSATNVTQILAGTNITLTPSNGFGAVTIAAAGGGGGGGDIPAGSTMLFYQAAAPTGWTRNTTLDNRTLRVVGTGGGVVGGTIPFTTAFASKPVTGTVSSSGSCVPAGSVSLSGISVTGAVQQMTLSLSQIFAHAHDYTAVSNANARANFTGTNSSYCEGTVTRTSSTSGQSAAHTHNWSGSVSGSGTFSGSNTSVTVTSSFSGTPIDLSVQYIDVLVATKN